MRAAVRVRTAAGAHTACWRYTRRVGDTHGVLGIHTACWRYTRRVGDTQHATAAGAHTSTPTGTHARRTLAAPFMARRASLLPFAPCPCHPPRALRALTLACACVRACLLVCARACMCVCACACACARVFVHLHVCARMCVCVCVCLRACVRA